MSTHAREPIRPAHDVRSLLTRALQLVAIVAVASAISYAAMLAFFQFVYPLFLRGTVEAMVLSLYGGDLSGSSETRFVQGMMFLNGMLMSLTGTIIISAVAYFIVTRSQEKATETALNIERLRLLHELESDIEAIQSTDSVLLKHVPGFADDSRWPFNVALTGEFKWSFEEQAGRRTRFIQGVGRMEKFLADNDSLITTDVLHRALHWYRRIDRGRAAGLVTDDDLYLLWRYILTFATDGRYRFLDLYFCGRGRTGSEDIDAIRRTLVDLIAYSVMHQKAAATDYLRNRVDQALLNEVKAGGGIAEIDAILKTPG